VEAVPRIIFLLAAGGVGAPTGLRGGEEEERGHAPSTTTSSLCRLL
jgi:hypothetical protein